MSFLPIIYTTSITPKHTLTKVDGKLHSINDEPAEVRVNGSRMWYFNGKKHRDGDKPAGVWANGTQRWYIYGKRHRDGDKPAEILADGTQRWFINGKLHRDGDKPAEIWPAGTQFWYINGNLHRDNDQPAVVSQFGENQWYVNGRKQPNPVTPVISVPLLLAVNKFVVSYRNTVGIITQIISINNNDKSLIIYKLSFDDEKTYAYIIDDIKVKDLTSVTKMRVLWDDGWTIAAKVGDDWIVGVPC